MNNLPTLTRLMAAYSTRNLADGPTAAELAAEADYAAEMEPVLDMAYLYAINQLQPMVSLPESEIKTALLNSYRRDDLYSNQLYNVTSYNGRAGYNVGGQIGLDTLGLDGSFNLENEEIAAELEQHYTRLSDVDGEYSLLETTAGEVAKKAKSAEDETDGNWEAMLALLLLWRQGRVVIRSFNIANTETVRMSRIGLLASFIGNGVTAVIHRTAGDDRVCPICNPLNGKRYTVSNIYNPLVDIGSNQIPLHGRCRCYYEPVVTDWIAPAVIWTGIGLGVFDE